MSSNVTTSSSELFRLNQVSFYLPLILGSVIFIGGLFGNSLNILLFFAAGNYKRNACSFYMLSKSFFDLGILLIGLGTALLRQSFQLDFAARNWIWCKLRFPCIDLTALSSLTCLCLESIDVFFASSRSAVIRQRSSVKVARGLVGAVLGVWICHGLPYALNQNLVQGACVGTNAIYTQYYRGYFVNLGLYVFIPVGITTTLALLIYQNLRKIISSTHPLSALTRQMTSMTLCQIAAVLLFNGPLGVFLVYTIATSHVQQQRSVYRVAQEQMAQSFLNVYTYGTYASSFYCYCAASKRFRSELFDALKMRRRGHQVMPAVPSAILQQ